MTALGLSHAQVPSYADAAMYYTEKMMKSFSDGIFYDDVFFLLR